MKNWKNAPASLRTQLKRLVADLFLFGDLGADDLADEEPLVGGRLGLDSLDAFELAICIEEEFGVAICDQRETNAAFASIARLAAFIETRRGRTGPAVVKSRAKIQTVCGGLSAVLPG